MGTFFGGGGFCGKLKVRNFNPRSPVKGLFIAVSSAEKMPGI